MEKDKSVPQWLRARDIIRRREKVCAPQFSLAHFSDLSESALSGVEAGRKMLSHEAQKSVDFALEFFEELVKTHKPIPVDFSNISALEPLFKEFKKSRLADADEVVRTNSE